MSFRELDIKRSYISYGDENIASSFLVPTLKHTKLYRRSVGFFSSSVFAPIIDGIVAMSRNDGNIQLIASPNLNEEDIEEIPEEIKEKIEFIFVENYKEIYKKKQWMCKKLIIINFNFPSDYAFSNSHLQFFSFRKIEHFLNEIKMKYLVNEKTNHAKQIGYISKKFNKNKKIVDNIVNLAYQNEYMSIYDFDSKVYEE